MCELVEVSSVTYKGGGGAAPIEGTISAFDGKRGQVIYRGGRDRTVSSHKPSNSGAQKGKNAVKLLLTGPHRAISAEGCVSIKLDLHHDCKPRAPYVAQIPIDIYSPSTEYDVIVKKEVPICKCKNAPRAKVKYALLSDALEAIVQAKLVRERDNCFYVHKIIARSDAGEVILFESNEEKTRIKLYTVIPLARSVVAVPLTSTLKIEVDLRGRSNGETREDYVVFKPDFDCKQNLVCHNGEVEVTVTWSG